MDPLLGHQKSIVLGHCSISGKLFNESGYRGTHVAHETQPFFNVPIGNKQIVKVIGADTFSTFLPLNALPINNLRSNVYVNGRNNNIHIIVCIKLKCHIYYY